jgi:GNAT superfamily N-acetyltransferase
MELRTLRRDETAAWLELLDGFELGDGWRGRDLVARPLEVDPRFDPKQVWVAADGDGLVAAVQLLPRRMRLLGHSVPCGGIGGVFTRVDRRGEGIASRLLARAIEELRGAAVELALAFAPDRGARLLEPLGFERWRQEQVLVSAAGDLPSGQQRGFEIEDFDAARDLESVVAIHSAYSAARSGTLVRDATAWQVSLVLAGNPDERFRVALRDGRPVAYLRSAHLDGRDRALELARLDDAAEPLAALVVDAIAPSGEGLVLPAFDDLPLTVALEQTGHACAPETVESALLCCLDAAALGTRLDIGRLPGEEAPAFLRRILPADAFTFWPADRF